MRQTYRYSGFGLTFDSEWPCPVFAPGAGPADARIRVGAVPEGLERPLVRGVMFEAEPDRILLNVRGTARFLIEAGREITVDPVPGAPDESVRVFLTPALGVLLLQRGALVLHAAACASARGAILLAGFSGRGKSTVLAGLLARGHRMLADDVSAVGLDGAGHPIAQPAFSRLGLLTDSLHSLGLDPAAFRRVRPGVPKYSVPADFCPEARPIRAVYVLEYHHAANVRLQPLAGHERLSAIRSHVYSPRLAEGLGLHHAHFSVATTLAATVPVVRVSRPRGLASVGEVVAALEQRSL